MKLRIAILLFLAGAVAIPSLARAQAIPKKLEARFQNHLLSEALLPDSRFVPGSDVTRLDNERLRDYFHHSALDSLSGGYLATGIDRLYGIERYEVSPARVIMEGADLGASLGMFAGALGATFGWWDENTGWYLAGAAAAAGAAWSGTHADDPGWRVRYRWEP